jgi:hypothetical protein
MEWDTEEFCKKKLSEYLKPRLGTVPTHWQRLPKGEDPPDFYLTLGDTTFAVEVTQTEVMRRVRVGVGQLRQETYESTHKQFVEEVEQAAHQAGILNGTYGVSFLSPMTASDYPRAKKHVLQELLHYIDETQFVDDAPRKVVFFEQWDVCWIMKLHGESNRVFEVLQWWEWPESPDVRDFVCRMLQDAVDKKKQKLEKKGIPKPRILLLLNTYPFANQAMYHDCIYTVHSLDFFHTIFVVLEDGRGFLLRTLDGEW